MTFEEKIEKYSASSSTTKIREQRANFLFLTDGSLVYDYEKFKYDIDAAILDAVKNHGENLDEMIMLCYHQVTDIVKEWFLKELEKLEN